MPNLNLWLSKPEWLNERHEVGEIVLDLGEKIACDLSKEVVETSRFVLVHRYRQSGGGLIEKILSKYEKEEISTITCEMRAKQQGHRGKTFFLYGAEQKKLINWAQEIEKTLFRRGILVYTSLFEPHKKEAYLMAERVGAVLLLVGDRLGMDLNPSCCISFNGVGDIEHSADKILDLLNE